MEDIPSDKGMRPHENFSLPSPHLQLCCSPPVSGFLSIFSDPQHTCPSAPPGLHTPSTQPILTPSTKVITFSPIVTLARSGQIELQIGAFLLLTVDRNNHELFNSSWTRAGKEQPFGVEALMSSGHHFPDSHQTRQLPPELSLNPPAGLLFQGPGMSLKGSQLGSGSCPVT